MSCTAWSLRKKFVLMNSLLIALALWLPDRYKYALPPALLLLHFSKRPSIVSTHPRHIYHFKCLSFIKVAHLFDARLLEYQVNILSPVDFSHSTPHIPPSDIAISPFTRWFPEPTFQQPSRLSPTSTIRYSCQYCKIHSPFLLSSHCLPSHSNPSPFCYYPSSLGNPSPFLLSNHHLPSENNPAPFLLSNHHPPSQGNPEPLLTLQSTF